MTVMTTLSAILRGGLALGCGLLVSEPASAAGAPRTAADVRIFALNPGQFATSGQDGAALLRALEIEFSSVPLDSGSDAAAAPSPRVVVSVECQADTDAVTLRVRSSGSSRVEQRSIVLRDVPVTARPRMLALVIAEALGSELAPATSVRDDARPAPVLESAPERDSAPELEPAASMSQSPAPPRKRLGRALLTRRNPYAGGAYDAPVTTDDPTRSPALRLGIGSQARLALDPSAVLLAFEASASGVIERYIGWGAEASYAAVGETATDRGEIDVSWWNASAGFDFIATRRADIVVGPRLSVGHFSAARRGDSALTEATLVTQLGGRATFTSRLEGDASLAMTFAAQRTVGVAALGSYTGLDTAFHGWIVSWGIGVALDP
jgi:hypothetical protein